jgi:hypothetical protein
MNEIDKIIEEVTAEHPYKERGNPDSYNQYNEGWSDACDILGEKIKQALSLYSVVLRSVPYCECKEETHKVTMTLTKCVACGKLVED